MSSSLSFVTSASTALQQHCFLLQCVCASSMLGLLEFHEVNKWSWCQGTAQSSTRAASWCSTTRASTHPVPSTPCWCQVKTLLVFISYLCLLSSHLTMTAHQQHLSKGERDLFQCCFEPEGFSNHMFLTSLTAVKLVGVCFVGLREKDDVFQWFPGMEAHG